jgi:diguanylate cyclase (GGDEF)-like protein
VTLVLLALCVALLVAAVIVALYERGRAVRAGDELVRARAEAAVLERRDADTGLYNSRHFVETLTREIERARTYSRPVALALASVDELRDGPCSAETARAIGTAVGGSVRALDVACRVGTSEFGIILPETDGRAASVASERVLRALARVDAQVTSGPRAAIGIASCPSHAGTFEELVERAGSALRSARRAVRSDSARPGTVTVSLAVWEDE